MYNLKASPGGIIHVCDQFSLVRQNGTAHTNYSPGFCLFLPVIFKVFHKKYFSSCKVKDNLAGFPVDELSSGKKLGHQQNKEK